MLCTDSENMEVFKVCVQAIHSGKRGGNTYCQDVEIAQVDQVRILYKMKSIRSDKIIRTNVN